MANYPWVNGFGQTVLVISLVEGQSELCLMVQLLNLIFLMLFYEFEL